MCRLSVRLAIVSTISELCDGTFEIDKHYGTYV